MELRTKRVYKPAMDADGRRILVDRLWPRGLTRESARIDFWAKDIAPSHQLRGWYQHDPAKWEEFRTRYFAELDANPTGVAAIRAQMDSDQVTLLFSSKEKLLNHAVALRDYLLIAQQP